MQKNDQWLIRRGGRQSRCDGRGYLSLERALQRPRTELRMITGFHEKIQSFCFDNQLDSAARQTFAAEDVLNQPSGNFTHVFAPQPLERNDARNAIKELRLEEFFRRLSIDRCVAVVCLTKPEIGRVFLRAEVRRHDDDRIREINSLPARVRETCIAHYAKQQIEERRMRLLD